MQLTVALDGTAIEGSPLKDSGSNTLNISSGQTLDIQADLAIDVINSSAQATVNPLARTSTGWTGTIKTDVPTTMTLTVSARDFPELSRVFTVNVTPGTLAVGVSVDGASQGSPVGAGGDYQVDITSGQTVALNSNLKATFGVDLQSARVSERVSSNASWQAKFTSEVETTAVFTVSPEGDDTRVATVRVHILPSPLQVSVAVDGTSVTTTPVVGGEERAFTLHSGQVITLSGNVNITVTEELGSVIKTPVGVGAKTWAAGLSGATATEAVLTVTATADSTQVATIRVLIDPTPLEVTVNVDGTQVTTTPVLDGATYIVNINSGQTVTLNANQKVTVTESLGNVRTPYKQTGSATWAAKLTSSANAEATLAVSPQGDTSRTATIKVQVAGAPLTADISVDNVATGTTLASGDATTLNLSSGQRLTVTTSVSVNVQQTLNSATRDEVSNSPQSWSAILRSAAPTTVKLVFTAAQDASQSVTVNVVLDQIPLQVTVKLDEVAQPVVGLGETVRYEIKSGQKVVVASSQLPIDVSPALGDAIANGLTVEPNGWGAVLTSFTDTVAVLKVSPQGAPDSVITLEFHITPTQLSIPALSVDGIGLVNSPITAGTTLDLASASANGGGGVELRFNTSISMVVNLQANSALTVVDSNAAAKSYYVKLKPSAATTAVLTVSAVADPTQIITINLPLTP